MYDPQLSVFLLYGKPTRPVRGIGWLIDSGVNLGAYNLANLGVNAWGYRNVLLNPRNVRNGRDFYWGEEFAFETASFFVCPSEAFILLDHKMV